MLHTLTNLQYLTIERKKVVLSGEKGQIELAVYGPSLLSVFYTMKGQAHAGPAQELYPLLFSERYQNALSARQEWRSIRENDSCYELSYGDLRVQVDKTSATVTVYHREKLVHGGRIGDKDTVLSPYPLRVQQDAAGQLRTGKFTFHLDEDDVFLGLGEKAGGLNRRNRSFRLFNKDSLGYNAELSDPLYKSIPFYMVLKERGRACCGLYFPNFGIDEINFGVESNYYYHVSLNGGPYGYFLLAGDSYREVLRSYGELVGMPALPPLFSFGYLGSSMGYTDPDNAEEKVLEYFRQVEERQIPCEGMYFSSGYAKAESGERYTFVWNRKKFTDPAGYLKKLARRGYHICCNVKPGILTTHPWYAELARSGVFISDSSGQSCTNYYWGNSASLVDFHKEAGYRWWIEALTENIIDMGASGVWNDNNEFELEDESLAARSYRSALPVLMAKASYEALRAAHPGKRPWLISRSGYAGIQRFARTWTGDNVSDFRTLHYNILMGLGLGLSGVPMYGHDIGGFVGPKPDPELLTRWCQSAVFQPRFVMHSWKPDGSCTEPWSYPESTDRIVALIRERYRFLPYIYNLAIEAFLTGVPLERPLALEFPEDAELSLETADHMAGDAILVFEPPARGETEVRTHLPAPASWYDPQEGRLHRGGENLTIAYPLEGLRYMIRCGSVVPVNEGRPSLSTGRFPELTFLVFPMAPPAEPERGRGRSVEFRYREDDGESDFVEGSYSTCLLALTEGKAGAFAFTLKVEERAGNADAGPRSFRFRVPAGFHIEDGSGNDCGREYRRDFTGGLEDISFNVKGAYA